MKVEKINDTIIDNILKEENKWQYIVAYKFDEVFIQNDNVSRKLKELFKDITNVDEIRIFNKNKEIKIWRSEATLVEKGTEDNVKSYKCENIYCFREISSSDIETNNYDEIPQKMLLWPASGSRGIKLNKPGFENCKKDLLLTVNNICTYDEDGMIRVIDSRFVEIKEAKDGTTR